MILEALAEFLTLGELGGVIVNGLAKSALYVMIASGLTLIFGLMGVLNFAHGSLTMIGAYLGGLVMVVRRWRNSAADPPRPVLRRHRRRLRTVAMLGGAIETTIIRPLYDRPPIYQILLTFGLTLVIEELARIVCVSTASNQSRTGRPPSPRNRRYSSSRLTSVSSASAG